MKKLFALVLSIVTVLNLTACGDIEVRIDQNSISVDTKAAETEDAKTEPAAEADASEAEEAEPTLAGGWTLNNSFRETEIPEDEAAIFEKAMADADSTLLPIGCLGHQVVAGLNHAFLCYEPAEDGTANGLYIARIYQDLEGNAEVIDTTDFDIAALLSHIDDTAEDGENDNALLAGGWSVNPDLGGAFLPDNALNAFVETTKNQTDATYLSLALLGTQVVAGENFAVLCKKQNPDGSNPCFVLLKIYMDLEGGCTITNEVPVDLL